MPVNPYNKTLPSNKQDDVFVIVMGDVVVFALDLVCSDTGVYFKMLKLPLGLNMEKQYDDK